MRVSKQDRAVNILSYCQANSGTPLTISGIAQALGRKPLSTFRLDLAYARHLAHEAGEQITNCWFDPEQKAYVFYHLTPDNEHDLATPPLAYQVGSTRTRIRNTSRQGEWVAQHGETPVARTFGKITASIAQLADGALRGTSELEAAYREEAAAR